MKAQKPFSFLEESLNKKFIFFKDNTLFPLSSIETIYDDSQSNILSKKPLILPALLTAYSSTPWETDENPLVTASGKRVKFGIVANNLFPFGTKVKFPEIFGEKIFVVEDRMNPEKENYHFDVWFDNYWEALKFGTKRTIVEILNY